MPAIREFEKRFRALLDALDDLAAASGDEDLEELNAEFDDALFMLEAIDPKSEDAAEEFADALEEFEALKDDYVRRGDIGDIPSRLDMLIRMARANMGMDR